MFVGIHLNNDLPEQWLTWQALQLAWVVSDASTQGVCQRVGTRPGPRIDLV